MPIMNMIVPNMPIIMPMIHIIMIIMQIMLMLMLIMPIVICMPIMHIIIMPIVVFSNSMIIIMHNSRHKNGEKHNMHNNVHNNKHNDDNAAATGDEARRHGAARGPPSLGLFAPAGAATERPRRARFGGRRSARPDQSPAYASYNFVRFFL